MKTLNSIHPDHARGMTTEELRAGFLVGDIMVPGETTSTYAHDDRVILGGLVPTDEALELPPGEDVASAYFLEKRELGVFNVGGPGSVDVEGTTYELAHTDCLYIGRGARKVLFSSSTPKEPARFYFNSTPSYLDVPARKITMEQARKVNLGSPEKSNVRVIHQYIHPEVAQSCMLTMGLTVVDHNNVWNTMPPHLHDRRMEVYFYWDFPDNEIVFHFMGEPEETRHLVVKREEAVISPSWSIHGGAGTTSYSFIWGMAGENKDFGDMAPIPLTTMK